MAEFARLERHILVRVQRDASAEEPRIPRKAARKIGPVAMVAGLVGLGIALAFVVYALRIGDFSFEWGSSSVYSPLVAALVGAIGAALLLAWILVQQSPKHGASATALTALSWIFVGFAFGLFGPGLLGKEGAWQQSEKPINAVANETSLESAFYDLKLSFLEVPNSFNPYSSSRPGPSVAFHEPTEQVYFALNDPGTTLITASTSEFESGQVLLVSATLGSNKLEQANQLSLSEIDSRISFVPDIGISGDRLVFSNVELRDDCFVFQVWAAELSIQSLQNLVPKVVMEIPHCIALEDSPTGEVSLFQSGGAIASGGSGVTYVSIGDFGLGVSTTEEYSGRPPLISADVGPLGVVMRIGENGAASVLTSGHRNPQGLFMNSNSGDLWSTEHGPRGGGELNLLVEGSDYGWPDVTVGAPYGSNLNDGHWEVGRYGSDHKSFTKPVYSWLPSIAPSALVAYTGNEFAAWSGDLIVSSLRDEALHRVRVSDSAVLFIERIPIGERDSEKLRIRDLVIVNNGHLLLTFDSGQVAVMSVDSLN